MINIGGPNPIRSVTPTESTAAAQDTKLHKVSNQLEAVFIQEMYKSMRSTVPSGGVFNGGSGEEMFTGMLDEHIAADTPQQWKHGLSESIYRQLRDAINAQNPSLPPESSLVTPTSVER